MVQSQRQFESIERASRPAYSDDGERVPARRADICFIAAIEL